MQYAEKSNADGHGSATYSQEGVFIVGYGGSADSSWGRFSRIGIGHGIYSLEPTK